MAEHPGNWAERHGETLWETCVAPPDRPSIQGWANVDQLLNDMDEAGIEKSILQGWYWETMETCQLHNRFYAGLITQHTDRLIAFASIQPLHENALEEVTWAKNHGFSGMGEIHPQAQGFSLGDSSWQEILEHIRDWSFPINLHVTEPVSGPYPGKIDTPLGDYIEMAASWPEQAFILAHLGGLIPLHVHSPEMEKTLANVYYDCAAIPLLYNSSVLKQVVDTVGPEKILFGTDYPLRVFPRDQKQPDFTRSIHFIQGSGLTEKELRLVFSTNAKRLFNV
jgi:predicted TIM-barrel fold metal-dependent hydrolase